MFNLTLRKLGATIVSLLITGCLYAQLDIFQLMERRDLRINQVEALAKKYFDSVGTGRGTGFKQYQRWLYETGFHLYESGYRQPPNYDWETYDQWKKYTPDGIAGNMLEQTNANGPWTEKGPTSWTRTSGWNPGVGRITGIAVDPADTTVIYVTSPGGGLWKSTTSGATWAPLTDVNGTWMDMYSVTIDPANRNIVYAGSNSAVVIKSTDGGATWTAINKSMSGTIRKILIQPGNSNIVFVAAQNGIFRSVDGGANWVRQYANPIEDIEFKPGDPSIMYASGSFAPSILRSVDGGITWTGLTTAQGITNDARSFIGVTNADPNKVYIIQASGGEFGRMYVSNNSGASFTTSITGSSATCTNFFGYETTGCGSGGQAGYDMAICVSPTNANEVYIAGIIVWKSTDGGLTFAPQTAWSYPNSIGYNHADVHALEWVKNSIYSGSDGGIYLSKDQGDNWTDLSKGLGVRQFYRIANSKTNSQLFTGGAQDNGSSIFTNGSWTDWLGADGMDCIISPKSESLIWGTSQNGSLYRSTNGGSSYSTMTKPSAGEWVTPLAFDEATNAIFGGWTGVFKSLDSGKTWINLSGTNISTTLSALVVAPSNANYIYTSKSTTLYTTKDGGASWTSTILPAVINAITVSPNNPLKVYVACNSTANRVFVSTDGGATFSNISENLPAINPRAIVVDNDADETLYLGMNIGVYYRNNTTTGWVNISDNMPAVAINDLEIQKSGSLLRIATYGRGVWERPLITTTAVACGIPTSITNANITETTADVSWNAVSGATAYKVEYKTTTATTWNTAASNLAATATTITGLTAGTVYDWRVAAICSTVTGDYALSQLQTSAVATCAAPLGLLSSNITETSATLSWDAVGTAVSYTVDYKLTGSATWTSVASATAATSVSLSNLTASNTYDWRVSTNCGTASSAFTADQITTASPVTCTDIYETNNTSKQSKSISLGVQSKATIGTSTDQDWFKFSTGNNTLTNVRISTSQMPDDYDVYLYDKNLKQIGSSLNTGTMDETIIFNTKSTRVTYYVKVEGKSGQFNANSCYAVVAETSNTPWSPQPGAAVINEEFTSDVIAYPNPANARITLKFRANTDAAATLIMTNASGVQVKAREVSLATGINQLEINVSDMKPGLYLVQVKNGTLNLKKQVIILR